MSNAGQILTQVRAIVEEALTEIRNVVSRDSVRIDRVEERVSTLEDAVAALQRKPARPSVKARASAAEGTGEALSS